jgi:hypothetical protein
MGGRCGSKVQNHALVAEGGGYGGVGAGGDGEYREYYIIPLWNEVPIGWVIIIMLEIIYWRKI